MVHNTLKSVETTIFKQNAWLKEAKRVQKEARLILSEFEGKAITKQDFSLFKKVKDKLNTIECFKKNVEHYDKGCYADVRVYFLTSEYDIYANIKFCYLGNPDKNGVSGATYFEEYLYIGKIENHVLSGFYDREFKLIDKDKTIKLFVECQNLFNEANKVKDLLHFRVARHLSDSFIRELKEDD